MSWAEDKLMGVVNPQIKAEIERNRLQLKEISTKYDEMLENQNQMTLGIISVYQLLAKIAETGGIQIPEPLTNMKIEKESE